MRNRTVLTALALTFSLMVWIQLVTTQVGANRIPVDVDIDPDSLLLKDDNYGKWITAYILFRDANYEVNDIKMSSVTSEVTGEMRVKGENVPWSWCEFQGDVLMVKFDRAKVVRACMHHRRHMMPHMCPRAKCKVTLRIMGNLYNGDAFEGSCTIKVFFTQL